MAVPSGRRQRGLFAGRLPAYRQICSRASSLIAVRAGSSPRRPPGAGRTTRPLPSPHMRRFVLPGLIAAAAVALLALLTFGVSQQTDTSSIDSLVSHGKYPMAPNSRALLPVLGRSGKE